MDKPLLSILIPVYNVEPFLRECLDSVLGQSYDNLQVVMVNDGSTDGSLAIMNEYAARDSRVEVYSRENRGVAATRNDLLDHATGDFVLFVDSDDWLESGALDLLMLEQAEGDYDMVSFQMVGSGVEDDCVYTREEAIAEFLKHKKFRGSLWNKATRGNLFRGYRFDIQVSYGEDALMTWHVLQRVRSVRITPHHLYNYRVNDNSLSHSYFSEKKFSAYYAWSKICEDVSAMYPQHLDIARARFAIEMTLLLRDAARCGVDYNEHIRQLQAVVRDYGHLIGSTRLSSRSMRLYAFAVSHCYRLTRMLSRWLP